MKTILVVILLCKLVALSPIVIDSEDDLDEINTEGGADNPEDLSVKGRIINMDLLSAAAVNRYRNDNYLQLLCREMTEFLLYRESKNLISRKSCCIQFYRLLEYQSKRW